MRLRFLPLPIALIIACGGRVGSAPDDAGFNPDSSTIPLPRDVCGPILTVPEGNVYFGAFVRDSSTGTYRRQPCYEPGGGSTPNKQFFTRVFGLMKTPVTNRCYRECVASGVCLPPAPAEVDWTNPDRKNKPVGKLSLSQARTFCGWAGGRLPTIVEVTRAAQGSASYPGVHAMTDASVTCRLGGFVAPSCARYTATVLGPAPDHTDHDVDSLPSDTGPFGHVDLAAMAIWTRTYLRHDSWSYCPLPDGAPDFVSEEPDAEGFSLLLGDFLSTLNASGFGGSVAAQDSLVAGDVGVRCAFD